MSERDIDAEFADIIARFGDVAPRPAEDGSRTAPPPAADPVNPVNPSPVIFRPDPVEQSAPPDTPWPTMPGAWRGSGPAERDDPFDGAAGVDDADEADDGEHFVPPPVELPPGEDIGYWGAVAGLVLGPLAILYAVVVRPFHSSWWVGGGLAAAVAGFALLVLREPHHHDEGDGSGAQV